MADTFFGFDTSLSNLNDDEGGGGPSEDEYDALNDETFGQDSDILDWEVEHEHLAEQLESSRRHNDSSSIQDDHQAKLEASLSQLVLDETDSVQSRTLGSSVWRPDLPFAPTPVLKNVCTVEELERQLRQNHQQHQPPQPPHNAAFPHNFFQQQQQPRFAPVILQRPPGLQAPVPLPFAPQQNNPHNINQMSQPPNNIIGNTNQMPPNSMMPNHMGQNVNHMGQNVNQMGQNVNQMGQNANQFMQNVNQMNSFQNNMMHMQQKMQLHPMNPMGQNVNQMAQNVNQMSQNVNHMGQNNQIGQNVPMSQSGNQMGQNMNHLGQNVQMSQGVHQMAQNMNQMGQTMNQMGQNANQMGQNVNQMSQTVNQIGQNVNQMLQNGNQFNPGMNQFPQMIGQPPRMMGPPGMNVPRPGQNFNQNVGPFNHNFRGPSLPSKQDQPINQPNMMIGQPINQLKHQPTPINQKQPQIQPNLSPPKTQNMKMNQQNLNQQNLNQQNLNQQNLNQQNPNSKTPPQKSRVYNNSKTLTSQNLVQLIQNTHPMLHFNSSFHNASHHPMLNNRNTFNNQFQNNHMFNNQRSNGSYGSNNINQMNGELASVGSDTDEYAGLMSQREKQWLINIQMLQLSSGTPYIHDFYYTVFLERKASKEKGVKEAHKANQQNHPFYSNADGRERERERERHNSARLAGADDTPRTYAPAQFENSLGKLQCGSVTAPRKIIDVEVVGGDNTPRTAAPTPAPTDMPREMKRTKQLLLDIEALYLVLLRLEELNDPLAISNALILKEREEKARQAENASVEAEADNVFLRHIEAVQRRSPPQDKRQVVSLEAASNNRGSRKNLLDEDRGQLCAQLWAGLLHERLAAMLAVRKGRTLITRFLSRVNSSTSTQDASRLRALWARALKALPQAARREPMSLAQLAPHFASYISNSGWAGVLEAASLLTEAIDPARPHALATPLTLSCVCALIEKASVLANTPEATSNERQWFRFLKNLARTLKNNTHPVAKPVTPLQEHKLLQHLKQLESRSTIEILQRGKTASEFADLTKNDVSEQLVKYLC